LSVPLAELLSARTFSEQINCADTNRVARFDFLTSV